MTTETEKTTIYRARWLGEAEVYIGPFAEAEQMAPVAWAFLYETNEPCMCFYGRHQPGAGSAAAAFQVFWSQRWNVVPFAEIDQGIADQVEVTLRGMYGNHRSISKMEDMVWAKVEVPKSIDKEAFDAMVASRSSVRRGSIWFLPVIAAALLLLWIFG